MLGAEIANHLLDRLSLTQALAVGQHYGQDTPLLDITINPEVAVYFATKKANTEVGIVGH
jgi:FRG domain